MPDRRVGIVGMGVLGSAIAEVLVRNGFQVVGCDRDTGTRDRLQKLGVEIADTAIAVAGQCKEIITCLPTTDALHQIVSELAGCNAADLTVIEVSTFPVAEKEIARDVLAAKGIILLDCPLSGNRIMALKGELTAFGSGDKAAVENVRWVLEGFCRKVHYVGPFGDGMKMKICGNILNLVHNSAAAEVMVLGMKSGLAPEVIHEVISGSASSSRMFDVRGKLMVDEDYSSDGMNFSIPLKDARIITEHAASLRVPTPVYQAALQPYYAAVAQGHHDEDASAVCTALERAANVSRKKKEE